MHGMSWVKVGFHFSKWCYFFTGHFYFLDFSRAITKLQLRQDLINRFHAEREDNIKWFVGAATNKEMRSALKTYLGSLKK